MERQWSKASPPGTESTIRIARFSWRALVELATSQHNVVSLAQLVELGLPPSSVRRLVADRKLRRIYRGVYAVSAAPLTREGNWMAAVLACGPGALLSHQSNAMHLGLRDTSRSRIDVISRTRAGRSLAGIHAHTAGWLLPRDVTVRDGIPCTSVACTLLHIAAAIPPRSLLKAVDQAETEGIFDLRAIEDVLERNPGRRGTKALRGVLHTLAGEEQPLRQNDFEERFNPIVALAGLPKPIANHWMQVGGEWFELDFYWPSLGLGAEMDGGRHLTRAGRRRDRLKDRKLAAIGIQVVRYLWHDLEDPPATAAQLAGVAAQRAAADSTNSIASATSSVIAIRSS